MYIWKNFRLAELIELLKKEWKLEWANLYAAGSILLFALGSLLIVFLVFQEIDARTWIAVYWIMFLFSAISAIVRSFSAEYGNRQLYYYTLFNPLLVLLSKLIYNSGMLLSIGLIIFGTMSLLLGNPLIDNAFFVIVIVMGSVAIASLFTFIASISAKSSNSTTMMAILGFPVVVPILLVLIKLSLKTMRLSPIEEPYWQDFSMLFGLICIVTALSIVLFPMLWRD